MVKLRKLVRTMRRVKRIMSKLIDFLMWFVPLVIAAVGGLFVWNRMAKGSKQEKHHDAPQAQIQAERQAPKAQKTNSEADREERMQAQREANRLDTCMQILVGGSTGMLVCRKIVQEEKSLERAQTYRLRFLEKQRELRELYAQYEALKEKTPTIDLLENDALYHELMDEHL